MSKHPIDIHVGKKIRLQRKISDLSQDALAGKLGITFQQVRKYETADNRVSASRLMEIAMALGVPINFFFDGFNFADEYQSDNENDPMGKKLAFAEPSAAYNADVFSDPEAIDLVKYYYQLPPATRKKMLDMIKAVAADKPTV